MATKRYRLKDNSVGFYDRETGAKVVGDGVLEIDDKKRLGTTTLATIKAGGLIEVDAKTAKEGDPQKDKGKPPAK